MKTFLSVVAIVALAAVVFAQAPAGGGMNHPMGQEPMGQGPGRGMHGPGPMGMLAKLNLSEQQMQEVHKLMAENQGQQQADMEQMRQLHEQLRDQVFGDKGPTGNTSSLVQQVTALQAKMVQSHVALAEKLSGLLTADQRKQVREMPMGDLMGMMGMGMGPAPGRGPMPPKK